MAGLQIEQWPIEKLVPYARNPRKNDEAVPRMAGLIREFGFKVPVVARSDGTVVDGHLRLKAASYLGMPQVPVILADEWTEAQVKAFRIAVNKSAEWADWDDDLLKLEIEDLKDLGFDMDLIGFDEIELLEKTEDLEPDGFESDEFKEFEKNEDDFLAKKRLIIVFSEEEEMFVRKMLNINPGETLNVVYEASELARRAEGNASAGQDRA